MEKLLLLYVGTCLLAWLSQQYYPAGYGLHEHRDRHFMRDPMDIFTLAIVVWMTFFSGLRTAYNDTSAYINAFNAIADNLPEYFETATETGLADNPLFYIIQVLVKSLTNNYHVWFLLTAFVSNYVAVKFLRHYADSYPMAILLFLAIGTYIMYVAAVKQSIAVAIIMCAIPFALKKQWIPYYLLTALAILFHTHAFLLLILPLLMGKPWGRNTWIFAAATLFAMATYDSTLGAFLEYAQSIGANVAESEVFDGHSVNFIRVVVYAIPSLLALVFRQRLFRDSGRTEDFMVNMSILSWFILTIGTVEGGNLFARMAGYFEWATALALPWMIGKLFNRKSSSFVFFCAAMLYTGYFLYEFGVSKNFDGEYRAITLWQLLESLFG